MERLKRLRVYFNEMFPLIPRLCLGYIVFLEIYFIVLLNHGVTGKQLLLFDKVEGQSDLISYFIQHDVIGVIIGGFTIFSFLLWLRIADDFKDYELDCRLFATRPLPSGRVHKKDLRIFAAILIGVTILINILFIFIYACIIKQVTTPHYRYISRFRYLCLFMVIHACFETCGGKMAAK